MAEIIVFCSDEAPKLNFREIEILLGAMGVDQGFRVFERVMVEISDKLCHLELAVHENDLIAAKRCAKTIRTLCPQIGLESLAHVSGYIIDALEKEDFGVLPVICRRMVCLGEASLFQLAELPQVLADR